MQEDLLLPTQYLQRRLPDTARSTAWWMAVQQAVAAVQDQGRQCRVLLLGCGAGLLAVAALRAGAVHVTCVDT
jgi:protein arginine N-methyltransferase 7